MKTRYSATQLVLSFLVSLALLELPAAAQQSADLFRHVGDATSLADAPLVIQSSSAVDQELFLVHGLRVIYTNWPNSTDQNKITKQMAQLRQLTTLLRAAAIAHGADRELVNAYDNCLSLLDSYQAYLTNIGAINRQTLDKAKQGTIDSLIRGASEGAGREIEGASDQDALTGAAIKMGWEMLKRGYAISREREAAIQAEKQKFLSVSAATRASADALILRLTREHGWQPGEADLEQVNGESPANLARRRPRDPYALYALASVQERNETAFGAMTKANWCVRAAELVPAGNAYDIFRNGFFSEAVSFGLMALNIESPNYSQGPTASAPQVLRLVRTYLALNPSDDNSFGQMQLARALAFNGRYDEAVSAAYAASKYWGKDPGFAYRYAKLMSLTNSPDKAAELLAFAYKLGWNDINDVRITADLDNLRIERPGVYAELTTVKLNPSIRFNAYLPDDILIRNDSPFELTNIRLKAVIRRQGQSYTPEVEVKSIKPGETYIANGVTFIPGNSYDSFTYTLFCDQCRE